MRYLLVMVLAMSVGCGEPSSKGANNGGANNGGANNGGANNGGGVDELPVDEVTDGFVRGDAYVIIDLETRSCHLYSNCESGDDEIVVTGIGVAPYGDRMEFISLSSLSIRADGEEVPRGDLWSDILLPDVLEFDIETELGAMRGLRYETRHLPPHEVTAPQEGAELRVGEAVTVEWTPNDPRLRFQVDMANQPRDGTYASGDPGSFVVEADWIVEEAPEEQIQVGRRATYGFEGAAKGGFVHTHTVRVGVSVASAR